MIRYVWDKRKAQSNYRKHGVHFEQATLALEDPNGLTLDDPDHKEQRFITIGTTDTAKILTVVWTLRGEVVRIISARKAGKADRERYLQGIDYD